MARRLLGRKNIGVAAVARSDKSLRNGCKIRHVVAPCTIARDIFCPILFLQRSIDIPEAITKIAAFRIQETPSLSLLKRSFLLQERTTPGLIEFVGLAAQCYWVHPR
jgi:hypothetical protein